MDKKQEELDRLYRLLQERDAESEKAKGKRTIITILGFSIFYYWLFVNLGEPTGIDLLFIIIPSIMIGAFHVFVNGSIFAYLCNKSMQENETINSIKKRIREIEKGTSNY